MKYYTLPDERKIPALGLGTWKSSSDEVYRAVKKAITIGYRHIDCAPAYENEKEVGRALAESIDSGEVSREELWVTSKLWNNAHGRDMVQPALEQTLQDLQLDYLDLFLIHWPVVFKPTVFFPQRGDHFLSLDKVPISETWQAMEECVGKGLVRYIGVSNFSIKKIEQLLATAEVAPTMNQVELHPYLQQPQMVDYCMRNRVLLTAYSPLGSGDRPAALKKTDESGLFENQVICEAAVKHKATAGQILLSWALHRNTAVIPKSVNPERLKENYDAANILLDEDDMKAISAVDRGYRYIDGSFWEGPDSPYTLANLWDE